MKTNGKFESSAAFFEAKYRANADPWDFSVKAYELERYDTILRAVCHRRYPRAFEPGCSIGVLTERLADYCDAVDAIDFSATAVAQAKKRCFHLPQVDIRWAAMPIGIPKKSFDLLMLSEIGYYFDLPHWQQLVDVLVGPIPTGATVLAAHWLGESPDHCISGDSVHAILLSHPGLRLEYAERNSNFRLDRLVRL